MTRLSQITTFILLMASFGSVNAAFDDWPLSVRQLSLGYTIGNQSEPLLLFANPAAVASVRNWSMASSYARPYGLKELDMAAIGFAKRWHKLVFGLGFSRFGFELYKEQKAIFGVTVPIVSSFHFGFSARLQQIAIKNYGQANALTFDAGWQYSLSENVAIAGTLQNVNRATIGQAEQPLPQIIQMGLFLRPTEPINMFAEIYKDISFEPEARFGLEAKVVEQLFLRVGFTQNPSRFTAGFGLHVFDFNFDYGFSHHQILGYTHSVGFVLSR